MSTKNKAKISASDHAMKPACRGRCNGGSSPPDEPESGLSHCVFWAGLTGVKYRVLAAGEVKSGLFLTGRWHGHAAKEEDPGSLGCADSARDDRREKAQKEDSTLGPSPAPEARPLPIQGEAI